jgi:hypothetical protein
LELFEFELCSQHPHLQEQVDSPFSNSVSTNALLERERTSVSSSLALSVSAVKTKLFYFGSAKRSGNRAKQKTFGVGQQCWTVASRSSRCLSLAFRRWAASHLFLEVLRLAILELKDTHRVGSVAPRSPAPRRLGRVGESRSLGLISCCYDRLFFAVCRRGYQWGLRTRLVPAGGSLKESYAARTMGRPCSRCLM